MANSIVNDSRFTLRHGSSSPGELGKEDTTDNKLMQYELGYSDKGIIYSKNNDNKITIVAQELKYGTLLPTEAVQGQIFYMLQEDINYPIAESTKF